MGTDQPRRSGLTKNSERDEAIIGRLIPLLVFVVLFSWISAAAGEPETKDQTLHIACTRSLEGLARRLGAAADVPVEVSSHDTIHAIRQAAGLQADFALILGDLSPGARSLLSVKSHQPPVTIPVGWEVPRFVALQDSKIQSIPLAGFLDLLRVPQKNHGGISMSWSSALSPNEIKRRFLPAHEIESDIPEGFLKTSLEALTMKNVVEGTSEVGLVVSLNSDLPNLKTLPIEIPEGFIDPSPAMVENGHYPLATKINLISPKRLVDETTIRRVAEIILEATGQDAIRKAGYLPAESFNPLLILSGRVPAIHR
ncbi:MAG: hypothetical protein KC940_13510 [Candidatus Omnitrophica bacterium]|nr:hypothetical protein [Candidatus Omnitrophota bacterium]MCB9782775.1 hypothetical protein [Candidatus Omnitrophota bacterium]